MMHLSVKRRGFTDELSFTDGIVALVEPVVTIGLLLILVDDSG